jgi:hypothetical protein
LGTFWVFIGRLRHILAVDWVSLFEIYVY